MSGIVVDYVNISDSEATPASTFFAESSVDGGNNTGWKIYTETILVNFVSISDSTATPGSTFYAQASVDDGNNDGWVFLGAVPSLGRRFGYKLTLSF